MASAPTAAVALTPEPVAEASLTLAQQEARTSEITFADLGLSAAMLASLTTAGYARPTPIQAQAVPLALKGRDLMGLAQTGTGKTAAFTIPIIERLMGGATRTRALILTPTRELCQQVEESIRKYSGGTGLDVISVYGGVGYEAQTTALKNGVDIIVAT
ncbi:MAG: DEAD/DEAH box helicase, partial [Gemmatimonadaceae bacterium]